MDINPIYENLISDLVSSENGLPPYSLYQKYQIQPSKLAAFLTELMDKGLVRLDGDVIVATQEGKDAFKESVHRSEIKEKESSSTYYKSIQIAKRIKVNEPYMPSVVAIYNILQGREKETSSKE